MQTYNVALVPLQVELKVCKTKQFIKEIQLLSYSKMSSKMSYMSHNILATQLNCIGTNVLVSLLWLIISH